MTTHITIFVLLLNAALHYDRVGAVASCFVQSRADFTEAGNAVDQVTVHELRAPAACCMNVSR